MKVDLHGLGYYPLSPGSQALTDIFQEGIEYVKKYRGMSPVKKKVAVARYIRRGLFPKFKAAVLKYYGLKVRRVYVQTDPGFDDPVYFAMTPTVKTTNTAWDITSVITGWGYDVDPETAEEFIRLAESINQDSHKVNYELKDDSVPLYLDICIPNGAFLLQELTANSVANFTAKELTAIYLHEIAHQLILIERCTHTIAQSMLLEEKMNHFNRNADLKERIKLAKYFLANEDTATIDDVEALHESTMSLVGLAKEVSNVVDTFVEVVIVLILRYFPIILAFKTLMRFLMAVSTVQIKTEGGKLSDKAPTYFENMSEEINADEFISKNGMGSHQISALSKLEVAFKLGLGSQSATNPVSKLLMSIPYYLLAVSGRLSATGWLASHEEDFNRIIRLTRNSFAALKDEGLPHGLVKYSMEECERAIQEQYKYVKKHSIAYKLKLIHNFIRKYMSPFNLVTMIANGNYIKQYSELESKIEDLNTSKLWYQSTKIKSFIK